jgi:1-acyl-sn-glycerol-3-phosphate acyltransferase
MTVTEARPTRGRDSRPVALPRRWFWLMWLFRRYTIRYVRKHFHAVRLSRSSSLFPPVGEGPLLIVLNHPAWWDPMICIVLASLMRERDQFAAIDARAVERYAFFKRLGFVGVDSHSLRGAAGFLRMGATILAAPNRAFWVTAQGRFTDVRERPLSLASGVGHLAARLTRGVVLPIALEYAFWTERTPEALVRVGEPLRVQDHANLSGKEWIALIEEALTRNLDDLNAETVSRDPAKFITLLDGRSGVGGPYDLWRRFRAWLRGEKFDPSHEAAMRGRQS